ncbi:MAG: OadG family protein [Opitutaceae bacterium]
MNYIPIVIAAADAELPVEVSHGTTEVVVVGFLFVMVVLSLLSAVTAAIGAFFAKQAARDAARAAEALQNAAPVMSTVAQAAPAATQIATATEPVADEDDPVLVAVITAAVHSVIGDRAHRIVAVRPGLPGWAQEGRRQIFSSHRVR